MVHICAIIIFSGHHCDVKGCKEVLVMDGNMKNHRDIYMAREAGYITFTGLPGDNT